MSNAPSPRQLIIIGGGPAGLTAAIYAARAQLSPLVFEGDAQANNDLPGGQLMLTTEIENFPGFPEGIDGPSLMANMRAQAVRFGAEIVTERVSRVQLRPGAHEAQVGQDRYVAKALIVATGARATMLGVSGEDRLLGHGVSTCATCDGFFFRDQDIAVVGGGDTAMEEALFLTRFARKVFVVHRRDTLRASKVMADRALHHPKIEFIWNSTVASINGAASVSSVTLADAQTGRVTRELPLSGVFVAIGHVPTSELVTGQVDTDLSGYIFARHGTLTSHEGVFAAGDAVDHVYRQAITSAASGCMAAIDAERYLAKL